MRKNHCSHCNDETLETFIRIIMFLLFVYIMHKWINGEKKVAWGENTNYYPQYGGMGFGNNQYYGGYSFPLHYLGDRGAPLHNS